VDEIATQLGVSPQNAKVILHRGRQQIAALVQWEAGSPLDPQQVEDWPRLCASLYADKGRCTIAGVIWDGLEESVQRRIERLAKSDTLPPNLDVTPIVAAINGLLRQPDIWPKRLLTALRKQERLPRPAHVLLLKRHLGSIATLRLNRLIFEFGLAGIVAGSILEGPNDDESHG
jgi:hypothetical protein